MEFSSGLGRLQARAGLAPILGAQYFRPPFPERHRWKEDMRAMRRAGLSAAVLWVCWGWVEPKPGQFVFDDYDALIEAAAAAGLDIVLSTIAEIHPFWIHREIPGSQMVNHRGDPVLSVPRRECQVGLTPGGCFDHPEVARHMNAFLDQVARRYVSADALVAWDLWNETRWAVHSEGRVCYCEHTLAAFRGWLHERHGSLEGLNEAWGRRYCEWEDVDPGRVIGTTYTDHMEFQAFLAARASRHMRMRYDTVRAVDQDRLLVAHAMSPAPFGTPYESEQALSRGNDWEYTDFLDGFGASLFPAWVQETGAELNARLEVSRSAAQGRVFWVPELLGGSGRGGIDVNPSITGAEQQRWLWRAYGRGAKAVNFWAWRDEVFGRESSGFGLSGNDGHAEGRIRGLQSSRELLDTNAELLGSYQPDLGRIGVIFEPAAYQMDWAQYGPEFEQSKGSVLGYLYALERVQLPYELIESHHREHLQQCRLVIMPWPLIVDPDLGRDLVDWVRDGGTLLVESELDSYDALGFYRYPEERPFASALGLRSLGRRPIADESLIYELNGLQGSLRFASWVEPTLLEDAQVLDRASHQSGAFEDSGSGLLMRRRFGRGSVIVVGTFAGLGYTRAEREPGGDLELLLRRLATEAGALPGISCDHSDGEKVTLRTGIAGGRRLLFVTDEQPGRELRVSVDTELLEEDESVELLAGSHLERTGQVLVLHTDEWGRGVLGWDV
jgi:beta-galactosidase